MPQKPSLRIRLNLMIMTTVILIIGLGSLFAVYNARRSVEREIDSTVNLALHLIEAGVADSTAHERPVTEWLLQLGRLEHTRHLRIQVAGTTLAPINLTGPNPTAAAEVPAWFRWLIAPPPVVAEQRLGDGRGGEFVIRIEADSDDEIAESWQESQGFLSLLLVLAGAVSVLVHVSVGRAFRSVETILHGLEGIERGEYGQRLPVFALPEFARIAEAFNHMAAVLQKAQAENRALIRQSLTIQEEERRYLARELHDELGQSLTAIKVMAVALRQSHAGNLEPATQIIGLCDRLFEMFRDMMRRLRPSLLDELGLEASLEDLIQHWRTSHPEWVIEFSCAPGLDAYVDQARIHVFRIVQESLTNIVKHAEARRVSIALDLDDREIGTDIVIHCQDDGRGFDPAQPLRGFGLAGMRERVHSLGGRFKLHSAQGQGVTIDIRIPAGDSSLGE